MTDSVDFGAFAGRDARAYIHKNIVTYFHYFGLIEQLNDYYMIKSIDDAARVMRIEVQDRDLGLLILNRMGELTLYSKHCKDGIKINVPPIKKILTKMMRPDTIAICHNGEAYKIDIKVNWSNYNQQLAISVNGLGYCYDVARGLHTMMYLKPIDRVELIGDKDGRRIVIDLSKYAPVNILGYRTAITRAGEVISFDYDCYHYNPTRHFAKKILDLNLNELKDIQILGHDLIMAGYIMTVDNRGTVELYDTKGKPCPNEMEELKMVRIFNANEASGYYESKTMCAEDEYGNIYKMCQNFSIEWKLIKLPATPSDGKVLLYNNVKSPKTAM